jgi:glycosyltransferase involved in cell wall biosynthesis
MAGTAHDETSPVFLVLSNVVPWPEVSGSSIRAAATVRALRDLGRVDVFCMLEPGAEDLAEPPPDAHVERWETATVPPRSLWLRQIRWLLSRGLPRQVWSNDYARSRSVFSEWSRSRYDLVWIAAGAQGFAAFGALAPGPVVVNLNDVEHRKIDAVLELDDDANRDNGSLVSKARRLAVRLNLRLNRRRWRAYYARMAQRVGEIVVCSELEREHLGIPTAAVVPNIYPAPDQTVGRTMVGSPPTVSIIGQLHYAPNADAAAFFVNDVLPLLRAEVPDVQVRLVGQPSPSVSALADVDGVTVTGLVPDIAAELARADVCAVPIRFGGGTRIKILEAFAHRMPVISTTLGSEGLDVVDGRHLVLADDAASFASGCATLLRDEAFRGRLVDAAHRHWEERFTEEAFRKAVLEVIGDVAPRRTRS